MFDNIFKICNISEINDFKLISVGGKSLVFEGNYKIKVYENDKIIIDVYHRREIEIFGENLKLKTLAPKEMGITGKIYSINFGGQRNEEKN